MARFKIDVKINDGKSEAPPVEVECEDGDDLCDAIATFGTTDGFGFFGVGSTITVTRLS
jgi:hypothetical protein